MEITATSLQYSLMNINNCKFNRMQAEAIYRVLMALGATKDMHFLFDDESGYISIVEEFRYTTAMIPTDDDDGNRTAQRVWPLYDYIRKLVRFDRAAHSRMKNVEKKINTMHRIVDGAAKQLKA